MVKIFIYFTEMRWIIYAWDDIVNLKGIFWLLDWNSFTMQTRWQNEHHLALTITPIAIKDSGPSMIVLFHILLGSLLDHWFQFDFRHLMISLIFFKFYQPSKLFIRQRQLFWTVHHENIIWSGVKQKKNISEIILKNTTKCHSAANPKSY